MIPHTDKEPIAIVFGLFETGLGIARSLGQQGIKVIGVDFKKDIAWYSRYVKPLLCPHPLKEMKTFLEWIKQNFSNNIKKIPIFLSSDDFLNSFSINRAVLSDLFLFNIANNDLLDKISDKYNQYLLAKNAGIQLPKTQVITNKNAINALDLNDFHFPVFIKGLDVTSWREKISGTIKGFPVDSVNDLHCKAIDILEQNVPIVIQEIIKGPDTNHFKYNTYIGTDGQIKAEFTLRKIRQNPIHFGVGAVVESVYDDELVAEGRKLFKNINFMGIGSAEFKRDEQDGKLKLIEINPRYWQQNYLSTACGINFPHINYCDLNDIPIENNSSFKNCIKWVNQYMDFDSFLKYRKENNLTFSSWRKSLKGKKVYSDFTWDDPIPAFYEIRFGLKLIRIPQYLWRRICK